MDDLISRADAIDALNECISIKGYAYTQMHDALTTLPSAQPKIVRCKECAFADKFYHCNYMTTWNNPNDFCSRGERREP